MASTLVQKVDRGIFVSIEDKVSNCRLIHWFPRRQNETAEAYHNRCIAASKKGSKAFTTERLAHLTHLAIRPLLRKPTLKSHNNT